MNNSEKIKGFSKLSTNEKRELIAHLRLSKETDAQRFSVFETQNKKIEEQFNHFSENTLSAHALPFGIIPNVLVDGINYHVPAVTEESSVIAAASKAASFWYDRSGFKTIEQNNIKNGQIYFRFSGNTQWVSKHQQEMFDYLKKESTELTSNMEKRGGGIVKFSIDPIEFSNKQIFKLTVYFQTADSMGANFINSILENMSEHLVHFATSKEVDNLEIIMSILSNYTPENSVTIEASCPVSDLNWDKNMNPEAFAEKFITAMQIAQYDISRAVTHNKGIMNGTDAVVIATGNDFRAVEASAHSFASSTGQYKSLSEAEIIDDIFKMRLKLPMALGTVGGLTKLHPTAALAIDILQNPSAEELMRIAATVGLASNFSAIASLITTGIQQGHMKMHLSNILLSENATSQQKTEAEKWFTNKKVSVKNVREFLKETS